MQDISLQGHKEDGGPWRIDEAFQAASKEFNSRDNPISKDCLIMVNGEHETSRDSPALFADVAMAKAESSNEDNQGMSFSLSVTDMEGALSCFTCCSRTHTVVLKSLMHTGQLNPRVLGSK
jgi:hypothetical protein